MVDEEKFFAWLDGELAPEEAARVEAQVASDPGLRSRADEHRALAARLRGVFVGVSESPVPDRLQAALRKKQDDGVVSLAEARERRHVRRSLPLWKQAAAMAATLALGIAVGNIMVGDPASPIEPEAGRLVAGGELEEALYARLASAPTGEGPRIGLTYRDQSGAICRTFQDESASGLACRESGDWRIRAVFQAPEGQGADYRMAAGADPRLLEIVDETIAGEPLDEGQERAAKERGWR